MSASAPRHCVWISRSRPRPNHLPSSTQDVGHCLLPMSAFGAKRPRSEPTADRFPGNDPYAIAYSKFSQLSPPRQAACRATTSRGGGTCRVWDESYFAASKGFTNRHPNPLRLRALARDGFAGMVVLQLCSRSMGVSHISRKAVAMAAGIVSKCKRAPGPDGVRCESMTRVGPPFLNGMAAALTS